MFASVVAMPSQHSMATGAYAATGRTACKHRCQTRHQRVLGTSLSGRLRPATCAACFGACIAMTIGIVPTSSGHYAWSTPVTRLHASGHWLVQACTSHALRRSSPVQMFAQGERRPVRCPSCGKAQRADCDGNGKLTGGAGNIFDWSPVKAYKACPRYTGKYTRKGTKTSTFFDVGGDDKASQVRLMVPATWRSLTKIKLREYPDIKAPPTGDLVVPYEKFNVVDVIRRNGQHYLKLDGKTGWAFDRGIAGTWSGKPICERLEGANF